uniref:uncharacterized protein LOC120329979 isoform X2 n=1 Tax=Styela clava TaxID=7725 RepID=UPI001939F2EA|nr:uncharacterized protein LOC120329979 isoform X2 [Styela clava]
MRFYVIVIMSFVSSHFMMSVQVGFGPCVTKIKNGRFVSQGHCEKIDEEEIIGQLRRNVAARKEEESCPIYQDSKCFWPVKAGERTTNFVSAVSICAKIGRKLADIQSKKQYSSIVSYISEWLAEEKKGYLHVWTGMKYNLTINNLTLSDGTKAIWLSDYPILPTETKGIKVAIRVSKKEPMHKFVYLDKMYKGMGAICL